MARMAGVDTDFVIPFRGEYYNVAPAKVGLVQRLIYPIPDLRLTFLGVHLTPTVDRSAHRRSELGARAGSRGTPEGSVDWGDVRDLMTFSGT